MQSPTFRVQQPSVSGRLYMSSSAKPKPKPKVIFVLGGPGAGKGTQSEKLSDEFGITHLSVGDLLREERANPTSENGKLIESYLEEGKIVPVEISLKLLQKAIERENNNRYLIDGFPRSTDNLDGWNEYMCDCSVVEKVFFMDCHERELERRLLQRGKTSGRSDDNIESIKKRFLTFQESTMPVIKIFDMLPDPNDPKESMVLTIEGDRSVDDVYSVIRSSIITFIQRELIAITRAKFENKPQFVLAETPSVDVVSGKDATVTYILNDSSDGTFFGACMDSYSLGRGGWVRES